MIANSSRETKPSALKLLPDLTIPRHEAEEEINRRIGKGIELLELLTQAGDDLDKAAAERLKWDKYNRDMLRRLFDSPRPSEEYEPIYDFCDFASRPGPPSADELVEVYRGYVQNKIECLESIRERLSLYEEPSPPVDSKGDVLPSGRQKKAPPRIPLNRIGSWFKDSRCGGVAASAAVIGLVIAAFGCLAAYLTVPEFRVFLGLEPSATPTPGLEPVAIDGDLVERVRRETVDADRPVIAQWRWLVCQPQVIQDNLDALTFEVAIDGRLTASGDMAQYRERVREEDRYDGHYWALYWSFPMGAFESRSFHWLEVEYKLTRTITGGCDSDQDGNLDTVEPGTVGVLRFEVTVR